MRIPREAASRSRAPPSVKPRASADFYTSPRRGGRRRASRGGARCRGRATAGAPTHLCALGCRRPRNKAAKAPGHTSGGGGATGLQRGWRGGWGGEGGGRMRSAGCTAHVLGRAPASVRRQLRRATLNLAPCDEEQVAQPIRRRQCCDVLHNRVALYHAGMRSELRPSGAQASPEWHERGAESKRLATISTGKARRAMGGGTQGRRGLD